jgi:hypothetical protein
MPSPSLTTVSRRRLRPHAPFFGDDGSAPLNPIEILTPSANSGKRKIDCHERGCYPRFFSRGAGGWERIG